MRVRGSAIRVYKAPSQCPYCHAGWLLDDPVVACRSCAAKHHEECWAELGRCACCAERRVLREERGLVERWRRRWRPRRAPRRTAPSHIYERVCRRCGRSLGVAGAVGEEGCRICLRQDAGRPPWLVPEMSMILLLVMAALTLLLVPIGLGLLLTL